MPLSRPTSYYMPLPRPTSYYMPISCLNIHSRSRNPNQKTIYTDNKKFILLSKVCLYTLYIFMYVFLSRYNLLLSLYISPYIYIYTLYLPIFIYTLYLPIFIYIPYISLYPPISPATSLFISLLKAYMALLKEDRRGRFLSITIFTQDRHTLVMLTV